MLFEDTIIDGVNVRGCDYIIRESLGYGCMVDPEGFDSCEGRPCYYKQLQYALACIQDLENRIQDLEKAVLERDNLIAESLRGALAPPMTKKHWAFLEEK